MRKKPAISDMEYIKKIFFNKLSKKYKLKGDEKIEIYRIKGRVFKDFTHWVNFYVIKRGKEKVVEIIGATHSDGSRKDIFKTIEYLYPFYSKGRLLSVEPLFYDAKQKAMFYEAVKGHNLFAYIKKRKKVKDKLSMTAEWLAKLHQIKPPKHLTQCVFNKEIFDPSNILGKQTQLVKKNRDKVKNYLQILLEQQPDVRDSLVFTHGDMHPENVIAINDGEKISVIDFSNSCLCSPAFDVGSFMVQLYDMSIQFHSKEETDEFVQIFFDEYIKKNKIKNIKQFENELKFYQGWIALKSMLYCLFVPDENGVKRFEKKFLEIMNK